jgi:hypothetical protein
MEAVGIMWYTIMTLYLSETMKRVTQHGGSGLIFEPAVLPMKIVYSIDPIAVLLARWTDVSTDNSARLLSADTWYTDHKINRNLTQFLERINEFIKTFQCLEGKNWFRVPTLAGSHATTLYPVSGRVKPRNHIKTESRWEPLQRTEHIAATETKDVNEILIWLSYFCTARTNQFYIINLCSLTMGKTIIRFFKKFYGEGWR